MILKIAGLTREEFSSMAEFLASADNIIKGAISINHMMASDTHPAMFATLMTTKGGDYAGTHDVVVAVATEYDKDMRKEVQKLRSVGDYSSPDAERMVPARYLLGLLQSIGFFPEKEE